MASAPRNSPGADRLHADDQRHAAEAQQQPSPWRRSIRSDGSTSGASSATNSEAGEMRTAVSPLGTTCSPNVISRNGAATDASPSSSAQRGRARMSRSAGPGGAQRGEHRPTRSGSAPTRSPPPRTPPART